MTMMRRLFGNLLSSKLRLNEGYRGSQVRSVSQEHVLTPDDQHVLHSSFPDIQEFPNLLLHQYVWENIHKWPHHTAIECNVNGKKYSYMELYTKSKRFANSLERMGLKKGDSLAVLLPNIPEYAVSCLGAMQTGLLVTTVNPSYTNDELRYYLEHSNAVCVVCHPSNLLRVSQVRETMRTNFRIICTHDLTGSPPGCRGSETLYEDMVADSVDISSPSEVTRDATDVSLIVYSSGTTGLPKGTCLTHKSIVSNVTQYTSTPARQCNETHGDYQEVVPAFLPFSHIYGSAITLMSSLRFGCRIITMPKFDVQRLLDIIRNTPNINLYLIPPLLFLLGNNDRIDKKHLRNVREIMIGAAPSSLYDIDKVKVKSSDNIIIRSAYGLSESSPLLTLNSGLGISSKPLSVGKLLSNTSCKVVDSESGDPLPPNTHGELCFRGPQLMKCYLNNPKATEDTIDSAGWLHTGDKGYLDQDGFIYITDRIKDLIKVNGFQVAPAELEAVLRKYPGVQEAGVVGVPSPRTGETPVAFVQVLSGAKRPLPEDIKDFVASQLSKQKHISAVYFVESIPKTASGKILRKDLRKLVP